MSEDQPGKNQLKRPISPSETIEQSIPSIVYDAINDLIVEKISQGVVKLSKREITNHTDFEWKRKWWVQFEEKYKRAGWIINYNKWTGVFTLEKPDRKSNN